MFQGSPGCQADLLAACGAHFDQVARLMMQEAGRARGKADLPEERDDLLWAFASTAAALSECLRHPSVPCTDAGGPRSHSESPLHMQSPPTPRLVEPCCERCTPAPGCGKDGCDAELSSPTTSDTPGAFAQSEATISVLQHSTALAGDAKQDWTKDQMVLRQLARNHHPRSLRDLEQQESLQSQQCLAYRILRGVVGNPRYEAFWAIMVMVNTLIMILEEERAGVMCGHDLGVYTYYGSKEYVDKWWPDSLQCFFIIDCVFAAMFTFELILTFSYDLSTLHLCLHCPNKRPFWREPWDILDVFIVCFSNSTLFVGATGPVGNTRFLRIFRLVRLLRLVRLVRKVHSLDALHLMTTALRGSVSALFFSMVLLVLILTLFAMLMTSFLRDSYLGPDSPLSPDVKQQLYLYFGSYSRSMLSLFELALANWPQLCRFLMEEVHEGFGVFCICYKLSIGFAVIGVINGVFIQETFSVAAHDDFIMVRSRLRQVKEHKGRISRLFKLADQDKDGRLSRSEVRFMMEKRAIRTWLEAMDVRCQDGDMLFDLLSRDGEVVTLSDFVSGIGRLKGAARTIDLIEVAQNQNAQLRHAISTCTRTSSKSTSGSTAKLGCKE